jgi:MFS family permease
VLALGRYGRYVPRRRLIEVGLVALGVLLGLLAIAGPISRILTQAGSAQDVVDLSGTISLLLVVVVIAFLAGIAWAFVAITAQTQLMEDIPAEVRGRVFGVLNMLVSIASLLPIIIVGPIADLVGTTTVIIAIGIVILGLGMLSFLARGALRPEERAATAAMETEGFLDPAAIAAGSESHVAAAEQPFRERRRAHGSTGAVDGRQAPSGRPAAGAEETAGFDAGVPVLGGSGDGPREEGTGA